MRQLTTLVNSGRRRLRRERGATAVEYGIMVALIAAVIIVAVLFLGSTTSNNFDCTNRSISAGTNQC